MRARYVSPVRCPLDVDRRRTTDPADQSRTAANTSHDVRARLGVTRSRSLPPSRSAHRTWRLSPSCCEISSAPPSRRESPARPLAASPTLDRIKATGTVTFAYRDGAAPFSFKARNGRPQGYSVELCEKVAAAIGKALAVPALKIEWRPVDAANRLDAVASGQADAECGTTTITLGANGARRLLGPDLRRRRQRPGARKGPPRAAGRPQGQEDRGHPRHDHRSRAQAGAQGHRGHGGIRAGQDERRRRGAAARRQGRCLRVRSRGAGGHQARAGAATNSNS